MSSFAAVCSTLTTHPTVSWISWPFIFFLLLVDKKKFKMEATHLGFNDHFVQEVVDLLRPFPKHTRTLRNAALHVVADRHSQYLGRDECPTRAVDLRRILLSPNHKPQGPRCPAQYAARLLARLGRLEDHETCERLLAEFPPSDLPHSLKAAAACIILGAPLARVARYTQLSAGRILSAIATCLDSSHRRIVQLFDNVPSPPTRPRRFTCAAHLTPLALGDELPALVAAARAARGAPTAQASGDPAEDQRAQARVPNAYRF